MITLKRKDLSQKYNISDCMWKRRHDDVMAHLSQYLKIEEISSNGRYEYLVDETTMPDEIPPIPRKKNFEERKKVYEDWVDKRLPPKEEAEILSKISVAREAIEEFGREKYGHESDECIRRNYISPAMEKYGEHSPEGYWCWHGTYEIADDETVSEWCRMLAEAKVDKETIYTTFVDDSVFFREEMKDKKLDYYKVMKAFKMKHGGNFLIRLHKWWHKEGEAE